MRNNLTSSSHTSVKVNDGVLNFFCLVLVPEYAVDAVDQEVPLPHGADMTFWDAQQRIRRVSFPVFFEFGALVLVAVEVWDP